MMVLHHRLLLERISIAFRAHSCACSRDVAHWAIISRVSRASCSFARSALTDSTL